MSGFATNISAGPPDESGQTLTFHVSNDNTALFSVQPHIDESSGDLTYTPAGGQTGRRPVSVYLTDNGGGTDTSATKTFTITVRPPNAAPVAADQTGVNAVSMTQDTPKTITMSATDADGNALTFSIVGPPTNGTLSNFGAPSCSGNPSTCTETVDYHPTSGYIGPDSFTFKANDGQADSNTATVEITVASVNDPPTDIALSNNSIDENQPSGTTIGSLTPTDADTGENFTFTLQPAGCSQSFPDSNSFSTTGNSLKWGASYALRRRSSYLALPSRVTDDGTPNLSFDKQFTINVNNVDEAPTDIQLSNNSIAENQASGTDIGTLTTSDPDNGDTAAYTLANTGCGGGSNDNSSFQIGGVNSDKLQSAASFNFETKSSYTVLAPARQTAARSPSTSNSRSRSRTSTSRRPTSRSRDSNIDENKASGSLVGNLSPFGDPDSGETFTYTLGSRAGAGAASPDSGSFQTSGAQLQSAAGLDFEGRTRSRSRSHSRRRPDRGMDEHSRSRSTTSMTRRRR